VNVFLSKVEYSLMAQTDYGIVTWYSPMKTSHSMDGTYQCQAHMQIFTGHIDGVSTVIHQPY